MIREICSCIHSGRKSPCKILGHKWCKKAWWSISFTLVFIFLFFPGRHGTVWYPYLRWEEIRPNLEILPISKPGVSKEQCVVAPDSLPSRIQSVNLSLTEDDLNKMAEDLNIKPGGTWEPQDCSAALEMALIVPFRNRIEHLNIFLRHIHPYLQQQQIRYRIVVIEQSFKQAFNRAKLFNVGFQEVQKIYPYSCMIFHDVDLLPLVARNIYACTKNPRHMSSSLDSFRFVLPYKYLIGGALSMTKVQFEMVNGFSNFFFGWGGEDDDMYNRLLRKGLVIERFDPTIARYMMLSHYKELPSRDRFDFLGSGPSRFDSDGLNSLNYMVLEQKLLPLYTLFKVDV